MSKPAPTIITEKMKKLYVVQILKAETLWVITYRDKPFCLKYVYPMNAPQVGGPKYPKTAYNSPGHAYNTAEKLNALFETTDFAVRQIGNDAEV